MSWLIVSAATGKTKTQLHTKEQSRPASTRITTSIRESSIIFLSFTVLLLRFVDCVLMPAEYNELAEQKLKHEVADHGNGKNDEVVDTCSFGKITEIGGQRGKYQIEAKDFCHCHGNVHRRLEGIASIESEVPED